MTVILGLALLQIVLIIIDTAFTARRMDKFGTKVEMNKILRWFVEKYGIGLGLLLGRILPGLATVGLLVWMDWKTLLAFLTGSTFTLVFFQFLSMKLVDAFDELLQATSQADAGSPPPPTVAKRPVWDAVKAWLYSLKAKAQELYEKVF